MNTELRKQAKNGYDKNFHKAMSNCVFGKTMEDVRNQTTIKLLTEEKESISFRT